MKMHTSGLAALALTLILLPIRAQQEQPAAPAAGTRPNVNREEMWFAPTAEDWKKPCLVKWQRTWEDALELQRQTSRALLVCVNMDGEIASEHYAGVRYRRPETASLYDPYVCVIASVYRHTPRDFDEKGQRIPCPRFGTVTCGEHIALEPIIYAKYLDGRRISPRHIGVDLQGKEIYDVFYAWDTASVFQQIKDGAATYPPAEPPKGDRPLAERAKSRDATDRSFVESTYANGNAATRRQLLQAAQADGSQASLDLLRLAIAGNDPELAALARKVLSMAESEAAAELMNEALRIPVAAEEKEALLAALERIGQNSPRARTLSVMHRGLAAGSKAVDLGGWSKALAGEGGSASDAALPADTRSAVEEAEALIQKTLKPGMSRREQRACFLDARELALQAEKGGASGARVHSALAVAAYYLEDQKEAWARAEKAVQGVPLEADSWFGMVTVGLFAESRRAAIRAAQSEKRPWPGEWLADVHAAYAVLARHPDGEDSQVAAHYDFLRELGAVAEAGRVAEMGLERFPLSPALHDRFRWQALEERGVEGMESVYDTLLAKPDALPGLERFAGFSSLIAAEYHRRERQHPQALDAYARALARYQRALLADPAQRPTLEREMVLCLGGRARVALEEGQLDVCLSECLAAFARRPEAANVLDGLNFSAVDTAKMLRTRLVAAQRDADVKTIDAAFERLRAVDPGLLELPAYEFENGPPRRRRGN
jgi:tetratricopeptide (TPR) repeat protein